ncbi:growth factor receptor-bound protein 10-like isoform X2 [Hydractinia symbiolongicarpus]|uniref:growth factor receptor-bound protein 10-like isoform X2 n=1 Tax=Hydractinia symbiolongicarpus TaxID=13093 RepID=UPI00255115C0|nr:growth factor receptor-bound protein 10-like isoform X2 [Hydractinia symbiolongicarpus]
MRITCVSCLQDWRTENDLFIKMSHHGKGSQRYLPIPSQSQSHTAISDVNTGHCHDNDIRKVKNIVDLLKDINEPKKTCVKDRSKRLYSSADNSPTLSRRIPRSKVEFRERHNSISPRLSLPNIDKFDVQILCPDGQMFKAEVFKAWTAFQLAWKIAHVKGMTEKLALIVQEVITDLCLVRQIEDHEIVYNVMQKWAPDSNNSFKMIEDITKYDLFNEPAEHFPIEMLHIVSTETKDSKSRRSSLLRDLESTSPLYQCLSCNLYLGLPEFIDAHGAPYSHCFCLIPEVVIKWAEIKCFCVHSPELLKGWFSAVRLAKFGQQLYSNFKEAMSKEANLRRTNSARQSILVRRSLGDQIYEAENKAAFDFSGDNGRVISDPLEALRLHNEIAFEIPKTVKRRSTTFSPAMIRRSYLETKVWYHGKLDREQAIQCLKKHGCKEGMFLVRDSSTSHGNLVLTVLTKKGRITHHQIFQSCSHSGVTLYGIEHGPQFQSLELLIESYHSGAVDGADFTLKKPCPKF